MNARSPLRQRGAVTLIGALFLIFVIIVLLNTVQRMAASDIMDSALQNDSVEALFIAESGLERAAWRFSTGSTCAALTGETGNTGRGSFQVIATSTVGTLCRVRVSGSVQTTTVANTARRVIEGDFTPGSVPGGAWAVGEKQGGSANIDHWDGTAWSPSAAPAVPNKDLFGISCISGSDCWAVGEDDGGETIVHWDGSSWSRVGPYGSIPNEKLHSVTCVATDDCWAVGEDSGGELIIHWNGSSWSRAGPYGSIPDKKLYSVTCVATDDCWAVGEDSGGSANINHWDGSNWSAVSAPSVPDKKLFSIHCVASDDCWATGEKDGSNANLNHWDGSSWSTVSAPSLPNKDLNAVFGVPGGAGGSVQLVQWTEVVQ